MKLVVVFVATLMILAGCNFYLDEALEVTRPSITIASITPDLESQSDTTESPYPAGVFDALPSTMGICFEAAWDAAGRVFVMRSAQEHINFYDLADNSNLCRRPVGREPFDFSTGDILAGIWNRGTGCTATHEIIRFERDDNAKQITIEARFSTEGDCPYELVRGLWLGIQDAQDFEINLTVSDT